MANVLGELFQDIADAIRGKTGEVALLKPNEFAAAIDSIVVGSGDSSGGTIVDGAGNVKFASGRFDTTTAGVYRQTIEHGLGEIPDFVAVFACNMGADASDYAVEDYRLAAIYGASSDYSSKLRGYSAFVNGSGTNANGNKVDGLSWSSIDKEQSDLYSYWHIIQCPNADTFTVGWNDNYSSTATGQYLFLPNTVYRWVAISGIGSVAASDDVRYVTFMNGDTVLYKKAVATGDDCVDVLTKGLIETPTKESDAQYDYTFYGWGASDGGAADDTILQNITEDKTVYSIYTKTLRYYTITWLDEDGVTELPGQTQWAYGTVPSYTPTKEGYAFDSWTPTPVAVTGDASYTAVWTSTLASGTCGNKATWVLLANGAMTISGSGAMTDYTYVYKTTQKKFVWDAPWADYEEQITNVVIENGITSIGNHAFRSCGSLTSVTIPDTVISIGRSAVTECSSLTSITIPDSVTSIGDYAFQYCSSMTNITIGSGLTEIGETPLFLGCLKITELHISDLAKWCGIPFYDYRQNPLWSNGGTLYLNGEKVVNMVIPNGVESIANYAFYNCDSITSVTIPDSVTSIGTSAFRSCTNLTSITFENTDGWWVSTDSAATEGDAVDVTDAETAATYLKSTYYTYYWYRT